MNNASKSFADDSKLISPMLDEDCVFELQGIRVLGTKKKAFIFSNKIF